jgi:hypothetical protein
MALKIWLCDGKYLANGDGEPRYCETDPCIPATYCGCTDLGPDTIDVTFDDVVDNPGVDCADCTTYNSTTYTANRSGGPGSSACTWSVAGECGHTIEVAISAGTVQVTITVGFTLLALYSASVSEPFDCTSQVVLDLIIGDADECDWDGTPPSTCTIN